MMPGLLKVYFGLCDSVFGCFQLPMSLVFLIFNFLDPFSKSVTFRFDKAAKNIKSNGSKNGKRPFYFAKSITKVQENVGLHYKKRLFKASLSPHTLKIP